MVIVRSSSVYELRLQEVMPFDASMTEHFYLIVFNEWWEERKRNKKFLHFYGR